MLWQRIFGIYSLLGAAFCLIASEFHLFPRGWSESQMGAVVFLAFVPPFTCLVLVMTYSHINSGEYDGEQIKRLVGQRHRVLFRRFPVIAALFFLAVACEIVRCFFDSQSYVVVHLFSAFFLGPAIMLLHVFPRSRNLIAQWKQEDDDE